MNLASALLELPLGFLAMVMIALELFVVEGRLDDAPVVFATALAATVARVIPALASIVRTPGRPAPRWAPSAEMAAEFAFLALSGTVAWSVFAESSRPTPSWAAIVGWFLVNVGIARTFGTIYRLSRRPGAGPVIRALETFRRDVADEPEPADRAR